MGSLNLTAVLPSTRKLIKAFEAEGAKVATLSGAERAKAVQEGAGRIVGLVVADGTVSERELATLDRIRRAVDPGEHKNNGVQQAIADLGFEVMPQPQTRSVNAAHAVVPVPELELDAMLPSSRELGRAMVDAAEQIAALPEDQRAAAVKAAAAKVVQAFDSDGKLSANKGRYAEHLAFNARDTGQYLPENHPRKAFFTALYQLGIFTSQQLAKPHQISW